MTRLFRSFWKAERGAVSVDWIILTAGMIAMALAVTNMVFSGTERGSSTLAKTIADRPVGN